jgi:hypothetical protein
MQAMQIIRRRTGPGALCFAGPLLLLGLLAGCSNAPQGAANRTAATNPVAIDQTSRTPLGMVVTWAQTVKARQLRPERLQWQSLLANEDGSVVCLAFTTEGQAGAPVSQRVAFIDGKALQSAAAWQQHCSDRLANVANAEYWINLL